MAETQPDHLTIGEVLGILVEEFPEVTISKIRFLESQGLIAPERTSSGYRRFHETDVDLLRVILTEQRENYLPLRVIRDRIASGEIDPSGELSRPEGIERPTVSSEMPVSQHPSGAPGASSPLRRPEPVRGGDAHLLPGVVLDRGEFRSMTGLSEEEIDSLESYDVIAPRRSGSAATYGDHEVIVARAAKVLLRSGIDARHLRTWRTAAQREASLIEQVVIPQMRQRDPSSRPRVAAQARELADAGGRLRAALIEAALRDALG
ncbi:MAG: MerR family transcriptional regulator [Actinomycetota bacterium]|jgi:DNA-binding transcriptional MerR regulator|nr:MerR family transcriptional regulator [Actinomycetota bacterium]MDA3014113.1 MerR family transcriptional regulator [Actinomycetota bacterium]MDA3028751.1 MerR family transcriptional regulator [Actinomycetota bacterium]